MEFFDSSKSIVENLSLLSGPIVAILGIVAILQLRLTKKVMKTNSEREAASLASQEIRVYNNSIIPLLDDLYFFEQENKLTRPKIEIGQFNEKYLIEQLGLKKYAQLFKEREKPIVKIIAIINALEAFATYFTGGVADEKLAFSAVGASYCYHVESMFFDLSTAIKDENDKNFQNVIELYHIWNDRIKKQKLTNQLEKLGQSIKSIDDKSIDPIGTK
nr:hypothetical protein [uncultured Allomuricauda sp.]